MQFRNALYFEWGEKKRVFKEKKKFKPHESDRDIMCDCRHGFWQRRADIMDGCSWLQLWGLRRQWPSDRVAAIQISGITTKGLYTSGEQTERGWSTVSEQRGKKKKKDICCCHSGSSLMFAVGLRITGCGSAGVFTCEDESTCFTPHRRRRPCAQCFEGNTCVTP